MEMQAVLDIARYCLARHGEGRIDLPWAWRRISQIHASYSAQAKVQTDEDGEFLCVTINGKPYAWPRFTSPEKLLWITCELELANHPHQYLWGPTTVATGDVVIDIGACEGAFSAMVAELGAVPVVVEPSRRMAPVIRRLFRLRQLPEPMIVPAALSDQKSAEVFTEHDEDVQGGRVGAADNGATGYSVKVQPLDDLVDELGLKRVDFIKCDAEGADLKILRGAYRTLDRFHPKLAFCTYHEPDHFDEMRAFLKPLGYRVKGKGLRSVGPRLSVVLLHAW